MFLLMAIKPQLIAAHNNIHITKQKINSCGILPALKLVEKVKAVLVVLTVIDIAYFLIKEDKH